MKRNALAALVCGLTLLAGCGGRLPMIGYARFGLPTQAFLQERKYVDKLTDALLTMERSVVPSLDESAAATPGGAAGEEKWKLRTALLGFGVNAQVGIGPFKWGIKPRLRAAFGNGENPPIP
jgi:hypothetical protein